MRTLGRKRYAAVIVALVTLLALPESAKAEGDQELVKSGSEALTIKSPNQEEVRRNRATQIEREPANVTQPGQPDGTSEKPVVEPAKTETTKPTEELPPGKTIVSPETAKAWANKVYDKLPEPVQKLVSREALVNYATSVNPTVDLEGTLVDEVRCKMG
jgi:hypothetical protein